MKNILNLKSVLQLNKGWQACDVKTPAEAISMVFSGAAKMLDTETMTPMNWKEWSRLPIREGDDAVNGPSISIRVPRVIIAVNYDKTHRRKIQCNLTNLRKLHKGKCAITGKEIRPEEGSREHVVPLSKGGKSGWGNEVYASKEVNNKRGNKTYEEVGLPPPKILVPPEGVPVSMLITNDHKIPEWDMFLEKPRNPR